MNKTVRSMVYRLNHALEHDRLFEYYKWDNEIPALKFKPEWEVKIRPPFLGAIVRFTVTYKSCEVNVYLDCYDMLAIEGKPYWEIWPDNKGDNWRCAIDDVEGLINAIQKSIDSQIKEEEE